MRAQRIKTGFHRIGTMLAALCLGWAVVCVIYWLSTGSDGGLPGAALAAGAAVLSYVLAWGIGWVIAGFVGDEISN
jgi:hypothetical protein